MGASERKNKLKKKFQLSNTKNKIVPKFPKQILISFFNQFFFQYLKNEFLNTKEV